MMQTIINKFIPMSKYTFTYSLLGLLILSTSCSQEELNLNGNNIEKGRIVFKASLPEVSTRATELKSTTVNNITVSSFTAGTSSVMSYFLDKEFTRDNITGKFMSFDPKCVWPNNGDILKFVAFAPSSEDMRKASKSDNSTFLLTTLTEGEELTADYKLTSFRVASDIASEIDFVTAIDSGNLEDNEEDGVTLKFQHQLSRIQINAWGASQSYDIEIAGVRIGGVATGGDFCFTPEAGSTGASKAGQWESVTRGSVEYIFQKDDVIVTLDKTEGSPLSANTAVSIMGKKIGGETGYDNSAMVIPAQNTAWTYKDNASNGDNHTDGMYFSILMRVTDTTPYETNGNIVYPYNNEDENSEVIYLAVDQDTKKTVKARLYKQGEDYYTDPLFTNKYEMAYNNAEVKAFGWAAMPVGGNWEPGYVYSYTLNYTNGVGLRDPKDSKPGEPIISDKVLVNVEMDEWITDPDNDNDVSVPRK